MREVLPHFLSLKKWLNNEISTILYFLCYRSVTADNKVLLVTVDGRQPGFSDGVDLRELSVIMRALKTKNAMNLDGGGSTTMYIKGDGIVNKISDASERSVANILYVK